MKVRLFSFVFILPLLLCACSKDGDTLIVNSEPRETQVVAEALQKVIDEQRPTLASVYVFNALDNSWVTHGASSGFKVCDPFIQVDGKYYHLGYLAQYKNNGGYLELYFKY
jgi:hypothetical protein